MQIREQYMKDKQLQSRPETYAAIRYLFFMFMLLNIRLQSREVQPVAWGWQTQSGRAFTETPKLASCNLPTGAVQMHPYPVLIPTAWTFQGTFGRAG